MSGLGRLLVAFGVLVLLFVVYLLWGTGIFEAEHQSALRHQFEQQLAREGGGGAQSASTSTTQATTVSSNSPPPGCTSSGPTSSTSTTLANAGVRSVASGQAPAEGQPVGIIQIPKIALDKVVVEGTGTNDLRLGPGHYSGTPLPGQAGNAAIAGHRTTYGAPFYDLNEMAANDPIYVTTTQGCFTYLVKDVRVVSPNDTSVVAPIASSAVPELTLTTCNPRFSSYQRLVVQADLIANETPAPTPPQPAPKAGSGSKPASSSLGLAGGQGSWTGALGWGAATVAVAIAVWLTARTRRRRWGAYAIGAVPVLVVLFLFFESVSPLLPASF